MRNFLVIFKHTVLFAIIFPVKLDSELGSELGSVLQNKIFSIMLFKTFFEITNRLAIKLFSGFSNYTI